MIAHILRDVEMTGNTLRKHAQRANPSGDHDMHDTLQRLFRYKAWANDELLTALARLGGESPITGLAIGP
jgi:hypothetical protein